MVVLQKVKGKGNCGKFERNWRDWHLSWNRTGANSNQLFLPTEVDQVDRGV